jgi:hypothetical protein
MPDGRSHSEYRHKSLESGVMRKYHAPFGGRPTEKGSIQGTSPAAHPTPVPSRSPRDPSPERLQTMHALACDGSEVTPTSEGRPGGHEPSQRNERATYPRL